MNTCERVMQSLGFACRQVGNSVILNTPFQSMIDGDMLQLFIEPVASGYRITDYGMTLNHAHSHGIDTTAKSKQLRDTFPTLFDDSGQIVLFTKDHNFTESLGFAFNALQMVNQQLPRWKPKPDLGNQFRDRVAKYFDKRKITYERNYAVTGRSGHIIKFPFSISPTMDSRNLIQCIPQGKNGIDWGNAYAVSGQMFDVKAANIPYLHRYVIIDDEGMEEDTIGFLANILSESSSVVPFSTRDGWINKLAA